jgi:hypothetical protein
MVYCVFVIFIVQQTSKVQVSDTTGDATCYEAGQQKIFIKQKTEHLVSVFFL